MSAATAGVAPAQIERDDVRQQWPYEMSYATLRADRRSWS